MTAATPPRVVLVTRPTQYESLLRRHGTAQQAGFFLRTRGQSLDPVKEQHERLADSLVAAAGAVPRHWRRARIERADLDRFLFEPGDIILAVGQDGLVANIAKYLDGQPVIGLNPDPDRYEGVLVPHAPGAAARLLRAAAEGAADIEARCMVRARLDDGSELLALNELFVGHETHQSARYRIGFQGREELHSSSGLIVATGTGATGWARSIALSRRTSLGLPRPADRAAVFFVREAWPSVATGADCVEGLVGADDEVEVVSRMDEGGVIFGDGIEADRIAFGWGRRVRLGIAESRLRLVSG
jgi:NAD kinase